MFHFLFTHQNVSLHFSLVGIRKTPSLALGLGLGQRRLVGCLGRIIQVLGL